MTLNSLTRTLSKFFRLFPRTDCSVEPEIGTLVFAPEHRSASIFPQIKFGKHPFLAGLFGVNQARHWLSDDGELSHIFLAIAATPGSPTAKYTRIILQVRFCDPDTNEVIEIVDYQPKADPKSEDAQAYGIHNNLITWDWQYDVDPVHKLGLTAYGHQQAFHIWIKAVQRVKAEFRFVGHYQDGKKKMKRSIPEGEGMYEQFLVLQDA